MQFQFPKRILLNRAPTSTSQFADGYKVPSEKTLSHLKGQFPPKTTLLKSQQNFQTRLRSNFLFTSILNIHLKSFQDYWSQVNSRQTFTDRHLLAPINQQFYRFSFVYVFSEGWFDHRSYDQTTLIRMYKQITRFHLKSHLKYILKVEIVTKSSNQLSL